MKNQKEVRLVLGLTLKELSTKSGICLQTLCAYETGYRGNPTIRNVIKVADALDCSVDYLTGRAETKRGL